MVADLNVAATFSLLLSLHSHINLFTNRAHGLAVLDVLSISNTAQQAKSGDI